MRAALSLDLDNKWSYMKTHGDAAWTSYPSYLNVLIPRVLDVLSQLELKITFFIVGRDAERDEHADALHELARLGHEIGNHSHDHEPWMHRRSEREIDDELARAEEHIERVTGRRPQGFRGPGFVSSEAILDVLVRRSYLYDASSFPTFIGPLARAYYFRTVKMTADEMRDREDLFGSFEDGFRANRNHRILAGGASIAEIPVTTLPFLRLPIHLSYVLYVATRSPKAAAAYFQTAMLACKMANIEPSILLHPLDFLSGEDCPELAFFPAMNLPREVKEGVVIDALHALSRNFEVVPVCEIARNIA